MGAGRTKFPHSSGMDSPVYNAGIPRSTELSRRHQSLGWVRPSTLRPPRSGREPTGWERCPFPECFTETGPCKFQEASGTMARARTMQGLHMGVREQASLQTFCRFHTCHRGPLGVLGLCPHRTWSLCVSCSLPSKRKWNRISGCPALKRAQVAAHSRAPNLTAASTPLRSCSWRLPYPGAGFYGNYY